MSASSGCPTASWNSTPPMPGASTTAVSPAGAGAASSIVIARRAATSAVAAGGLASMNSAPASPAGPWNPVWMFPSRPATAFTDRRTRGRISSTHRPSLVATSTRWTESPYIAVTWRISGPRARAASSASRTHATFRSVGMLEASINAGWTTRGSSVVRSTTEPAPSSFTDAAAASAARRRASRSRRLEYAYPNDVPCPTRTPAPRSRPVVTSSTLPSSRCTETPRRSSTYSSANAPPRARAARRTSAARSRSSTSAMLAAPTAEPARGTVRRPPERTRMRRLLAPIVLLLFAVTLAGCSKDEAPAVVQPTSAFQPTGSTGPSGSNTGSSGPVGETVTGPTGIDQLPTGTKGAATGNLRTGQAAFTVTGDLRGSKTLPTLVTAAYAPPPGVMAIVWAAGGADASNMGLGGLSFTGSKPTSPTLTLTVTVQVSGTIATFISSSGECRV